MEHFWDQPFERGNLDAGRLSWLFGRELKHMRTERANHMRQSLF